MAVSAVRLPDISRCLAQFTVSLCRPEISGLATQLKPCVQLDAIVLAVSTHAKTAQRIRLPILLVRTVANSAPLAKQHGTLEARPLVHHANSEHMAWKQEFVRRVLLDITQ